MYLELMQKRADMSAMQRVNAVIRVYHSQARALAGPCGLCPGVGGRPSGGALPAGRPAAAVVPGLARSGGGTGGAAPRAARFGQGAALHDVCHIVQAACSSGCKGDRNICSKCLSSGFAVDV